MQLTKEHIQNYRAVTFCFAPGYRVSSVEGAVDFINQRGFIFFWPLKNILMPSLWVAAAGDRPVPNEHDDPGHVTWGWKDNLLGKRQCYYGRVLRKRNTFISLEMLPYFYALSPNYGDPNEDYLIDYEQGRMTSAAKWVYEVLLRQGPQDTIALRKGAGLTSRSADSEFNHALDELQTTFRILPIGVTESGAWHYSFLYDLVPRHFADLIDRAHLITESEARQKMIECYLVSVGAAPFQEVRRIFGYQPYNWPPAQIERDLHKLEEQAKISQGIQVEGVTEAQIASRSLLEWNS